jgi:hypothetical protein
MDRRSPEMDARVKAGWNQPDKEKNDDDDEEIVNDSLGTTTPADSSGSDEEKETGDAKEKNFPTRED